MSMGRSETPECFILFLLLLQKTTPETVLVAQVPLDSAKGAKSRAGSAKQILVLAKL